MLNNYHKFNSCKSNDSESRDRELKDVLFFNDRFGFNNSVYIYLAEVFDDNVYIAYFYSLIDYRTTNASDSKLENLKKPELFDESKCALFAISEVLLEDHLEGLSEDDVDKTIAGAFLIAIKDIVSRLTESEQQKSNFEKFRIKALKFLEAENKRKRESSVKR